MTAPDALRSAGAAGTPASTSTDGGGSVRRPAGVAGARASLTVPRRSGLPAWLSPWLGLAVLLSAWQLASQWGGLAVSPASVASSVISAASTGDLWRRVQTILSQAGLALLWGGLSGAVLGALYGASYGALHRDFPGAALGGVSAGASGDGAGRVAGLRILAVLGDSVRLLAVVAVLAAVPVIALGSVASRGAQLALLSSAVFLVMGRGACGGVLGVDPKLLEMGRSLGLTAWSRWRDIVLPAILPALLSSLRLALALLWPLLLVLETLSGAAAQGAGEQAAPSGGLPWADGMALGVVLVAVLAKSADVLVTALSRVALRWQAAPPPAGRD